MNKKHIYFYTFLRPLIILFLKIRFNFHYKKAENLPDNYIVLSNHVTDYDMLFTVASFPKQMYFVASEHIARWKLLYKFLKFAAEPIMRYKGTVAASTVMEALKKIKTGANVCIFAEGVRTWDGVTCPILPSTGKMVKSARCGLVTYKITGGYLASPGWSDSGLRKGPIFGEPVHVYTKEEIAAMSVDEINRHINEDLYEDAFARQDLSPQKYTGKDLAKNLENLFFICPKCHKADTLITYGDTLQCTSCNLEVTYNAYGFFENAPFRTVRDYSLWQQDKVAELVLNSTSLHANFGTLKKIAKHEETFITDGPVSISTEKLSCSGQVFPMDKINDMDITGRHALVFSFGKEYYEIKIPDNTIKFLLYYRAYKNINKNVR